MAFLYVTEHYAPTLQAGQLMPAAKMPPIADQTPIANNGASTQSAAFNELTRMVCLHTDLACHVAFGSNPTATTSYRRIAANATEYFEVNGSDKVAVIAVA